MLDEAASAMENISEFIGTLSPRELTLLIDEGYGDDVAEKTADKRLKVVKEILKAAGEKLKSHSLNGEIGKVDISPSGSTEMSPAQLRKLLKKEKKENLFDELISVKTGELKKYVGDDVVAKYAKTETKEYGKVSFKPLKKLS